MPGKKGLTMYQAEILDRSQYDYETVKWIVKIFICAKERRKNYLYVED